MDNIKVESNQSESQTASAVNINSDAPARSGSSATTERSGLLLAAFICNLVFGCCGAGWLIIPLAWMIPMTVITYKIYKGEKKNTVAFGVCCLLFVSIISGILLLCAPKDDNN